jgi:5-(carboxyamino)imidazole ribonucleotide synthase
VPYTKELAIMAGCDSYGQLFLYPVVETIQNQQVCDRVIMPAPIPTDIAIQVAEIARQIVSSIGSAGIFGIELFLTGNGQILVNEIAPRTHNSGHYTIEACNVSQFSQLVRICAGQTAILPQLIYPCAIMVNLLGYEDKLDDYKEKQQLIQELPNVHLHWYGKTHSTVGRKLGHVTIAGDDFTNLAYCADQVRSLWYSPC